MQRSALAGFWLRVWPPAVAAVDEVWRLVGPHRRLQVITERLLFPGASPVPTILFFSLVSHFSSLSFSLSAASLTFRSDPV